MHRAAVSGGAGPRPKIYTWDLLDPADRFVDWHNDDRPHVPLDWSKRETPAQAYARKMPPPGAVVRDSGSGERYRTSGSPAGGTGASPDGGDGAAQKA